MATNDVSINIGANLNLTQAQAQLNAFLQQGAKLNIGGGINSATAWVDNLSHALMAAGLAKTFDEVRAAIWACVQEAIKFESALVGVQKTTDFTAEEMKVLRQEFLDLSTTIPMAASELAGIAEVAGQLGIEKDKITDFTAVMANLGVATNLSGQSAATMFSRFANITQMPQENFERLGSTITALGNNFATTEQEAGAMALRLASAGKQAGMSEADILGFSAALSALGIKAEMGGSAFSKALNKINIAVSTGSEELQEYACVALMTADEFSNLWQQDSAAAMLKFTEGLGNIEAHGANTIVLLDQLGMTEVRLSDALRRMAGSGELLSNALDMANEAWAENTALTTEAELRYGTTESKLKLLSNSAAQLKIAIGDSLTPALGAAAGGLTASGLSRPNQPAFVGENGQLDAVAQV